MALPDCSGSGRGCAKTCSIWERQEVCTLRTSPKMRFATSVPVSAQSHSACPPPSQDIPWQPKRDRVQFCFALWLHPSARAAFRGLPTVPPLFIVRHESFLTHPILYHCNSIDFTGTNPDLQRVTQIRPLLTKALRLKEKYLQSIFRALKQSTL